MDKDKLKQIYLQNKWKDKIEIPPNIDDKELINIDVDFIRELRFIGRMDIANKLVRAFQESVRKTRRIELSNVNKHEALLLKHFGICKFCRKEEAKEGHVHCEDCLKRKREYNDKRK